MKKLVGARVVLATGFASEAAAGQNLPAGSISG
jgi:hypothetical protein